MGYHRDYCQKAVQIMEASTVSGKDILDRQQYTVLHI